MRDSYNETYKNLYHGTIEEYALKIVNTQTFIASKDGWCGSGVYFYDNKAKAWWSANRTRDNERKKGKTYAVADVVVADIQSVSRGFVLDLRSHDALQDFALFVDRFFAEGDFEICEKLSNDELLKKKRALLLSFFCEENNKKLIIGYFRQQPQEKIDSTKAFADSWQLVIGIETIFCVKDSSIICNIRRGKIL